MAQSIQIPASILEIFAVSEGSDAACTQSGDLFQQDWGEGQSPQANVSLADVLSAVHSSIWTPQATPKASSSPGTAAPADEGDGETLWSVPYTPSSTIPPLGTWPPITPREQDGARKVGLAPSSIDLTTDSHVIRSGGLAATVTAETGLAPIVEVDSALRGLPQASTTPRRGSGTRGMVVGGEERTQRIHGNVKPSTRSASTGPSASELAPLSTSSSDFPPEAWTPYGELDWDSGLAIDQVSGRIVEMALNRCGSRVLQRLISSTVAAAAKNPQGLDKLVDTITKEMRPVIARVMCDTYANYTCQQLFQVASVEQRISLLGPVLPNLESVASDRRGTHSIQTLIGCMRTPHELRLLATALRGCTYSMAMDPHATHVLQKTIAICGGAEEGMRFSQGSCAEVCRFIYDDVLGSLEKLAGDANGLGVVKKCFEHSPYFAGGVYASMYQARIMNNIQFFVENPYANYAVQFALESWGAVGLLQDHETVRQTRKLAEELIVRISESVVSMSIHKFASNVVETALKQASDEMRHVLICRLIATRDLPAQDKGLTTLMNNSYGVFVMSTAVAVAPTAELCQAIHTALARRYQRLPDSRIKQKWLKVISLADAKSKGARDCEYRRAEAQANLKRVNCLWTV